MAILHLYLAVSTTGVLQSFANLLDALRTYFHIVSVSPCNLRVQGPRPDSSLVAPEVTEGNYIMTERDKAIGSPSEEGEKSVGLKNQGTTGWLSVVLQVFYHIKVLRKVGRNF